MFIERVLVLEDNQEFMESVVAALKDQGVACDTAENVSQAREAIRKTHYDLILSDVNLPDGTGIDILREQHSQKDPPVFVMMSGQATLESAIEAMRHGATDYLIKPFGSDQLRVVFQRIESLKRLTAENAYFRSQNVEPSPESAIIGDSPVMRNLQRLIQQVGSTDATALIHGESGSGKEVVARAMVAASPRCNQPYIKLNCAAIPENLVESELFGHEKGAFTGAAAKRTGRFEMAEGGTLLLDEVTEIPLALQVKLLRVLQEREFERVGGARTIHVDVRVLAATNRDLKTAVKDGKFREDLFYRLNVVPVHVPPLRDRNGDIDLLADHFLKHFARRHGKPAPRMSPESREAFLRAPWPGNVRELQNCVERAVILSDQSAPLQPSDFGISPLLTPASDAQPGKTASPLMMVGEDYSLVSMEKRLIEAALKKTGGNVTRAAKLLAISQRTLHYKLAQARSAAAVPNLERSLEKQDPASG